MGKLNYMDQSGLFAMEDVLIDLLDHGKKILLTSVLKQPRYMMESIDIIPDLISEDHISDGFDNCVNWVLENVTSD
jgi:SulP family sulfate permease